MAYIMKQLNNSVFNTGVCNMLLIPQHVNKKCYMMMYIFSRSVLTSTFGSLNAETFEIKFSLRMRI